MNQFIYTRFANSLTLIMFTLKLMGIITISWWLIFLPVLLMLLLILIEKYLSHVVKKKKSTVSQNCSINTEGAGDPKPRKTNISKKSKSTQK